MPAVRENFKPLTLDDVLDEEYDEEHMGKFRKIEIERNVVHIKCEDPYGFWKISLEKGQLPERLKGSYTTFDQALREVNRWLKDKKEPLVYEEVLPKKEKKVG